MFLGQFLVSRGVLTQESLDRVLAIQRANWTPLGQLAINEGYMRSEQVLKILQIQKNGGAVSKRFGEMACQEGFLTAEQVERLMWLQRSNTRMLGDILVAEKMLTPLQLIKELREHEKSKAAGC